MLLIKSIELRVDSKHKRFSASLSRDSPYILSSIEHFNAIGLFGELRVATRSFSDKISLIDSRFFTQSLTVSVSLAIAYIA